MVPNGRRLDGPKSRPELCAQEIIPLEEIEPWLLGPPARSLVALPTELSLLPTVNRMPTFNIGDAILFM